MDFIFQDTNPSTIVKIVPLLKDQNESTKKSQMGTICKIIRKIPSNYGFVDYDFLLRACFICGKHQKYKCKILKLSCGHVFHYKCIKNWLIENNLKCVICNSYDYQH